MTKHHHSACENGCNDAPEPPRFLRIHGIASSALVADQQGNAVDDCVHSENSSYPSMEKYVGAVRPVSEPEEDIVATGQEDDQRKQCVADVAGAVADIGK